MGFQLVGSTGPERYIKAESGAHTRGPRLGPQYLVFRIWTVRFWAWTRKFWVRF